MTRSIVTIALALVASACVTVPAPADPALLTLFTGEFVDDYGNRYTIDREEWVQRPDARYRLSEWHVSGQFVVGQNDADNPGDPGRWTRIDLLILPDDARYDWAYCYTEYRAATLEEALSAPDADRASPRTGCNGFPFSRMRRMGP